MYIHQYLVHLVNRPIIVAIAILIRLCAKTMYLYVSDFQRISMNSFEFENLTLYVYWKEMA